MELYIFGKVVVEEFCHHDSVGEVSVYIFFCFAEGDGVHSLIYLLQLFST